MGQIPLIGNIMQELSQPSEQPFVAYDFANMQPGEVTPPPSDLIQEPPAEKAAEILPAPRPTTVYPQVVFVPRSEGINMDGFAEEYDAYIEETRQQMSFPHEKPATEREQAHIRQAHTGLTAVADELGVNIRDRLPTQNGYHFFDDRAAYIEDARAVTYEQNIGMNGMCTTETGILWPRLESCDTEQGLTHETTHLVAAKQIHLRRGEGDGEVIINMQEVNGYYDVGSQGFNEMVTEMIAYRALADVDDPAYTSYPVEVQIGDAAVRETAAYHGIEPREVENLLIRGMLTGDREGIGLIDQAIGIDRSDVLLHMPGHLSSEDGVRLAGALGLPRAAENIKAWQAGKRPAFFDW
jgi:hypothetical protein